MVCGTFPLRLEKWVLSVTLHRLVDLRGDATRHILTLDLLHSTCEGVRVLEISKEFILLPGCGILLCPSYVDFIPPRHMEVGSAAAVSFLVKRFTSAH